MGPGAVLLVGEELLERDPARSKATGYLIDVQMKAMFGHARARSEADFRRLLDQSDFVLQRVIATASPISIVEAMPVHAES
jgi:hypothetical protein